MRALLLLSATLCTIALTGCAAPGASAQPVQGAPTPQVATPAPYQPYEFLIGEWDGSPGGGPAMFVDRFSWGPNRSYIWQAVSLIQPAGEHLHFEGPMLWNASTRRLDFLFTIEPPSLAQERGEVSVAADGAIVRDVTLTYANGTVGVFRHTIRQTGPDTALSSMMRQTEQGWAPEFPGSDRIEMRRRAAP